MLSILGVLKLIVSKLISSSPEKRSQVRPTTPEESKSLTTGTKNKEKSAKKPFLNRVDDYLNHAFFVYLHNSMVLDLVMGAMVNLNFMPWNSAIRIIHHLLSFSCIIAVVYLSYFLISILVNLEIKKRDKVEGTHIKTKFKRWLFLRVPIKENAKLLASFTPENYLVHDILLCVFLVLFNGIAVAQILTLILMKGYIFVLLLTFPMKEMMEQAMLMGNEFFFLGILIQFLRIELLPSLKKDHNALEK